MQSIPTSLSSVETGMDLRDLFSDTEFLTRKAALRDERRESIALGRLASIFTKKPEIILQKLVETAVEFCGADSAGISLEEPDNETPRFRWVAVAGSFKKYLNGTTPRNYSPCGACLNSGRPLHYTVSQPYYDFLGVQAEPILDGLLIPWKNALMKGTLWAVSHRSPQAFVPSDYELLKWLADFVSIAIQNQPQRNPLPVGRPSAGARQTASGLNDLPSQNLVKPPAQSKHP